MVYGYKKSMICSYFYILFNLFMFSSIPILVKLINKLLPPYDKKGSVTPVTGINPTTTIRFNIVWKARPKVIPKARYLPNRSSQFIDILNPLYMIVINRAATIKISRKPNSSLIIEKIKSVCGSGR